MSYGTLTSKTETVTRVREKTLNMGIGSKLSLAAVPGAEAFSAYANAAIMNNLRARRVESYQENAYIDFQQLKRDLIDLLDALEIKTLYVLIDEWSALDRRASPTCQVYFAEYLKRAFFGTSRICVKISAIEYESKFEDTLQGARIGLEVDADIFAQVNLDQIYNPEELNLRDFFEELIYKRLRLCDPRLGMFDTKEETGKPIRSFLEQIFEDHAAFDALIAASGGIPRDFINRFDHVASAHDYSIERKWRAHRINEIVIRISIRRVDSHLGDDRFVACVFDRIRQVARVNGHRMFCVPRVDDNDSIRAIRALFLDRLIHRFDLWMVPIAVRSDFVVYYLDYGVFLDLHQTGSRRPAKADINWPISLAPNREALSSYVLSIETCRVPK